MMLVPENIIALDENILNDAAARLDNEELSQLVEWLGEKDDKLRYKALLLLQKCSDSFDDVYPFWDIFLSKLKEGNSYQRSIGILMIAQNAKWDKHNKMESTIDEYLSLLNDEKPITVRQCIQALEKIIPYKQHLCLKIADKLMALNIMSIKETMRKLVLFDILNIIAIIKRYQTTEAIDEYIFKMLNGEILDKKSKRLIEEKLSDNL